MKLDAERHLDLSHFSPRKRSRNRGEFLYYRYSCVARIRITYTVTRK